MRLRATLFLSLFALFTFSACEDETAPKPRTEYVEEEGPILNFKGKITRKTQPLKTKRFEDRQKKILYAKEGSSPASLLILETGSVVFDVCREGFQKRRRVAAKGLAATLWIGKESLRITFKSTDGSRDHSGKAFRFEAKVQKILGKQKMLLVVDVPEDDGTMKPSRIVIPEGFEPY